MRKIISTVLVLSLMIIPVSSAFAKSKIHKKVRASHKITRTIKNNVKSRKLKAKQKPASRGESLSDSIIRRALSKLGIPYRYGSAGDSTFDCSGFTAYAFKAAGIFLPHSSVSQSELGTHVEKGDLEKGDLVFFTRGGSGIGHVGIYVGDNNFIHASTNKGVTVTSLNESYYLSRYAGARRVLSN